ncbi:MAG: PAS domain S-box protein [Nitrospira sp.]
MNPAPSTTSPDDLFRLILEAAPNGMLLVDGQGTITLVNRQIEQIFGYSRQELIGQPIELLMTDRRRIEHPAKRQAFSQSPTVRAMGHGRDLHGRRKDGSEVPVEIGLNPMCLPKGLHVLASVIDISERKKTEELIRHTHDNLDRLVHERTSQLNAAIASLTKELTDRKQAEEALRQSEERFAKVFRLSSYPIGITDLASGCCLDINDAALRLFEFNREEVIGHTTLLLGIWPNPEDRARMVTQLKAGTPVRNLELAFKTKSGSHRHILVSSDLIELNGRTCLLTIGHDITERKQAEAALRESHQLLDSVIQTAPMRVFWKDRDSRYLGCNQRFCNDAGEPSPQHIVGKNDRQLAWQAQAATYQNDDRLVMESGIPKLNFEESQSTPDGRQIWLRTSKVPLRNTSGEIIGVLGVYDDITEQKQAEAGLKRAEEQLQQSQKLEAVGRLAGGIAHDFNNLLTSINGNTELLLKQIEPWNPLYHRLDTIRRTGEQAARITRQLLTLGRKEVAQSIPVDLNGVIRNMTPLLGSLVGENIRLNLELSPSIGLLKSDPAQLNQIILNLAINARDAMPNGGTVMIETMSVPSPTPAVRLLVRDTGQGMNEEVKRRLFEPFFTTKPLGQGTGLGLATVYSIVTQHGGTIEVDSQPGCGTTFRITLPQMATNASRGSASERRKTSQTVLIVDDDAVVRELAREMLMSDGYHVIDAASGAEAIHHLEIHTGTIDLLLTDFLMPGMNGRELAEAILARRTDISVVFMSGFADDEELRKNIHTNAAAFLPKPFTSDTLLSTVRTALSRAERRRVA